jgi:hypothetical protein
MEITQEIIGLFSKDVDYSKEDITSMTGVDSALLNTWIKLGVYNKDKTRAFRLKAELYEDEIIVPGKNLINFLLKVSNLS